MSNYICWTNHIEKGATMEDNKGEDSDENILNHTEFGAFDNDTVKEEPEAGATEDDPTNYLGHA